jgi:hypothetical protein
MGILSTVFHDYLVTDTGMSGMGSEEVRVAFFPGFPLHCTLSSKYALQFIQCRVAIILRRIPGHTSPRNRQDIRDAGE